MLCRMLAATGVAGDPHSYFHRPDIRDWARGLHLPDSASLEDILGAVKSTARGGLTGIRVQSHSFPFLMDTLSAYGPTDPDRIRAAFGPTRFLWLRRTDKLAQAVSLLRAEQTGLWHRNADGTDLERLQPDRKDGYDAQAITDQINAFQAADKAWLNWFADHGITPWSVTYETLVDDPQTTLQLILKHLGQDGAIADMTPIQTARLADATSADWIARYRADPLAHPDYSG